MADGTVLTRVGAVPGCSASRRALSTRRSEPPVASGRKISKTDRPKLTEAPARTTAGASELKGSRAQPRKARRAPGGRATPFGRPGAPEAHTGHAMRPAW